MSEDDAYVRLVIVPNYIADCLNAALDKALANAPPDAVKDREHLYGQLLDYFDKHGTVPDFTIAKASHAPRGVGGTG